MSVMKLNVDESVAEDGICLRRGLTVIELVVVIAILTVLLAITISAVQQARNAALRVSCANRLRQLGFALYQYHDAFQGLPPGVTHPRLGAGQISKYGPDTDAFPLLNWHGRLLPFIEQERLWRDTVQAFTDDAYVQSCPPHVGITTPVTLFTCPVDGVRSWPIAPLQLNPASTSYLGVSGTSRAHRDGLLYLDSHIPLATVIDGTSNTLLIGERPPSLQGLFGRWYGSWGPWGTANAYLGVSETEIAEPVCPPGPYHFQNDRLDNPCSRYHFWSFHSGGGNFLFADGSVRFLSYGAEPVMAALATRAGGEVVSLP